MPSLPERLLALVELYPGLHVRELARQLGTSVALVEYHLESLTDRIELRQDGRFRRAYLQGGPEVPAADRRALDLLRRRWPLRIVMELLAKGPSRHGDLAKAVGLAKSGLSFHLQALEEARLVARHEDGWQIRNGDSLRKLLERWQPTPDLLNEFEDAWDDLYR